MRFYLYGIFPAPGPQDLSLEGLDKQPVQTQILDRFAVLYSNAQQEKYLSSRRNLLGHEKVLEQAMQAGHRSMLPLRFGLTTESWDTVLDQLIAPKQAQLTQLLDKLDGYREVSVKVFWNSPEELKLLMSENADLCAQRDALQGRTLAMEDVIAIGSQIDQAMAARREQIIQHWRSGLQSFAVESIENDLLTDAMIYNAAYLIPWDREPEFAQAVEGLDAQFHDRFTVRYNEFTAPYNFAQLN